VLAAAFGIDFAHLGITGLTYPASLAPLICLAWMVVGLALLGYFMVKDRSRITESGRVSPRRRRPSGSPASYRQGDRDHGR
jgi:hypothetical protein